MINKSIKVEKIVPKFKLLKPVKTDPCKDNIRLYNRALTIEQIEKYILGPASKDLVAVDIETRGLSPFYPHTYKSETYSPCIVGIGLAYPTKRSYKAAYFDPRMQSDETMRYFYKRLSEMYLIAHNAMFDGLWLRHAALELGVKERLNWVADTYGLYKHLAGADYIGQTHGLKQAQVELLGWDEAGDIELDEFLIANGYYTESGKKGERVRKAVKGEMWRCPFDILGTYCALDTISTLQLFDLVFEPVMNKHKMLWDYHEGPFIRTIQELIDQCINSMHMDYQGLKAYEAKLKNHVARLDLEFVNVEELKPRLIKLREEKINKIKAPEMYKKNGEISKNYLNYKQKIETMRQDLHYTFNTGSSVQLQALLYTDLYPAQKIVEDTGYRTVTTYKLQGSKGEVVLPATKSGALGIDKNAFPHLGEAGRILKERANYQKVLEYVTSYIECMETSVDKKFHPNWKVPGTLTGRVSGANPNILQVAKDEGKLSLFTTPDNYTLVSADFSSLENVVLAELSRDKSLLSLYGPEAKANCGYLFTGAHIAGLKEEILATGYDPNNPTLEGIAAAKKLAKKQRSIAKVVVLSSQYGASANKIHQTLNIQGIMVSLEEVKHIHQTYWELYSGVRQYGFKLKREWERNRGYILNGLGRPMSVGDHHLKDLINRACFTGNTLVLTNNGIKRLDSVTTQDQVWNGSRFCSHQGLTFQGYRNTINLQGVEVTPDHKIYTTTGTGHERADRVDISDIQKGNDSWSEVWSLYSYLFQAVFRAGRKAVSSIFKSRM